MDLTVLLEPKLDLARLTDVLDGMGHEGRLHTVRGWGKHRQAELFEAAKGYRPLTLSHFVPDDVPDLTEVIHDGRNTLPLFNNFQKRFCRPEAGATELHGYNEGSTRVFTGPGYYVATERDGELVIDYRKKATVKDPRWPEILPNSQKLGFLVYEGMVDYMRGLSNHVSIGRAEKGGKLIDAYFVLVRQDSPAAS
ncbi:MAG: hypothetical protein IPF92_02350 [Myxococcales bacterium]|nr:hypothetical protein [Myxococcales bacterium]MBL0193969.1 hypothetical protein [Myxococcales bacterium]HQY62041.1 hypothetical protein [Polyangiaceae bacterium]